MKKLTIRQQKIYQFIRKNAPVSNKQIKEHLIKTDDEISRITIFRELDKLVKEKLIQKTGKGRNVVYKEIIKNPLLEYIDPEDYFKIEVDKRKLIKESFNFNVFKFLSEDIIMKDESKDLEKLNDGYKKRLKKSSPTIIKKEFERLKIELSWKSSQIEGNTYSLLDTEILIKKNKEATGHTKEEATMILNHKKALDYILDSRSNFKEINIAKIENVHNLTVDGLDIEKNIRKRMVGITGTKYRPLDNEFQIKEALSNMNVFINNKKTHPLLKSMMAVLLLSYIQPFEDGNKRTARLIGNAILLAYNYCPLSYRSVDVVEYKKAMLLFYEQNNISYFKKLFLEQFSFAVDNYFG